MSTYLKNMAGYKHTQLKNKSFEEIQMLFEKEMKRVNIFVDIDAELVKGRETREESGSKRARDKLEQESSKSKRQGFYEIIRANGITKTYTLFSQLIKEFDREDLKILWKLVKTKREYTRPEKAYERVLWGDLEPDVKDNGGIYKDRRYFFGSYMILVNTLSPLTTYSLSTPSKRHSEAKCFRRARGTGDCSDLYEQPPTTIISRPISTESLTTKK
ncbi:hypothetical protein Tco_1523837 [Tanacetum coccineum]